MVNPSTTNTALATVPYTSGIQPVMAEDSAIYYDVEGERYASRLDLGNAKEEDLLALASACEPATFGMAQKDVLDEAYRKAGKMDLATFATRLDVVTSGLIDAISPDMIQADLRSRTVEMHEKGVPDPVWLAPFVAKRAALGMHISDVTLPCLRHMSPILTASDSGLAIHMQRHALSLMDGVDGHGFYLDEFNMRAVEFEPLAIPRHLKDDSGQEQEMTHDQYERYEWNKAAGLELVEEGIELRLQR
ncbi:hypothetical protein B0H19DRAFT_1262062 [Mycena capillaripes]|nr:hypothetical protein B0H19DRAFT_1262062 [Mycena capillaripes]